MRSERVDWLPTYASRPSAGTLRVRAMRTLFVSYLLLITLAIGYFSVVGLLHH
jgi:hypothetical protein